MTKLTKLGDYIRAESTNVVFLRVVSIGLLFIALQYWVRLTGVFEGDEYRYDTMSEHWRIASLFMAVTLPVTALGLWNGSSWGIVLWLPCAAIELTMHLWLTELFGASPIKAGFHLGTVTLYVIYVLLIRFLANKSLTRLNTNP
ncbi:MAG: DUF6163 family protein [Rhizobiaceae bacterium]